CSRSDSATRPTASRLAGGCCWPTRRSRAPSRMPSAMGGSHSWATSRGSSRSRVTRASVTRFARPSGRRRRPLPRGSGPARARRLDPDSISDSQIKRIHEYKRQLLNALRIVVLYNRLRENPNLDMAPRTFLFAGKAAAAYHLAKLIIKLLNNLAATINADPAV